MERSNGCRRKNLLLVSAPAWPHHTWDSPFLYLLSPFWELLPFTMTGTLPPESPHGRNLLVLPKLIIHYYTIAIPMKGLYHAIGDVVANFIICVLSLPCIIPSFLTWKFCFTVTAFRIANRLMTFMCQRGKWTSVMDWIGMVITFSLLMSNIVL